MVRGPRQVGDGQADLQLRVTVGLARLLVHHVGQLRHPAGQHTLPLVEQLSTLREGAAGPPLGCVPRTSHRGVDGSGVVDRVDPHDVTGGRVQGLELVGHRGAPRSRSAAFSPIMMVGAFVLPRGTIGITDASAIRSRSTPRTLSSGSTTACSPVPIAQVPTGWYSVCVWLRMCSTRSVSAGSARPGMYGPSTYLAS